MPRPEDAAELVTTRLDDLQAEMEAGARCVSKLCSAAADDQIALALKTADTTGRLMRRIAELRESVTEQRRLMQQLRHDVRALRDAHRRSSESRARSSANDESAGDRG